jgi:hypothetical protein
MKAYVGCALLFSASVLSLQLSAQELRRPGPPDRFDRPAPTNEIQRLQRLLSVWKVQDALQIPTPAWVPEIPEVERNALKSALVKPYVPNLEIAQNLLRQARFLKQNPEAGASAERIFVLAGMEGAADAEELRVISRNSTNVVLKEQARRLALLATAKGRPYTELSALGRPAINIKRPEFMLNRATVLATLLAPQLLFGAPFSHN